jgi:hypothetical protein
MERGNENGRASSVMGRNKFGVRAEHENGLIALVEHERVIREREKEKGEIGPSRW